MLTPQDLYAIGALIDSKMDQRFAEFEVRFEKRLDQKLLRLRQQINGDLADFLATNIIPQLDDHERRITLLEK